ncbi:MAG: AAA family ATPase [Oscillospiraceae bacterium]|nr:AAA family ATPase [Oscillospiraceae bacterium]
MPALLDRIKISDNAICRYIDSIETSSRGLVSQDILSQLTKLLKFIILYFYSDGNNISDSDDNLQKALEYVQMNYEYKELYKFYNYLQIVAERYTLDEDGSERLMLKYYQYMLETKILLKEKYNVEILHNLDKFPLNLDTSIAEYYSKISEKIENYDCTLSAIGTKYYVQKIKPFYVNGKIYNEVTFSIAKDKINKANRVIAFTKLNVISNYASKFEIINETINILDREMPILIIVGWEVAIRDCEFKNFISLITGIPNKVPFSEQKVICDFITKTGYTLTDLMDLTDYGYEYYVKQITSRTNTTVFLDKLTYCRNIIRSECPGQNLLRYLLFIMNNTIIKAQRNSIPNHKLANLYLQNGCIPFDKMPFIGSPLKHNPKLSMIYECIPPFNRRHEQLARFIRNNTENHGKLFTEVTDIKGFKNIPELIMAYNNLLWPGHYEKSKLVEENGFIYINGYKKDTCSIINILSDFTAHGLDDYTETVNKWLISGSSGVDCPEKKRILQQMYRYSKVAIIYGSAGVGKSTLINHISNFFSEDKKLYLAHTNAAVDNLSSRIKTDNTVFSTIANFLYKEVKTDYRLLVIDECSTVSNEDMLSVLHKINCQLILLVGDTFQIDSIRFGNWFSALKSFIPEQAVFELTKPYRSNKEELLTLWDNVRTMNDGIQELIEKQSFSLKADNSLLSPLVRNEAILCLNYDGLYGINNINRFMQENNPNPTFHWDVQCFKVGDPILFNDSNRFYPAVYNNMKGKIAGIEIHDEGTSDEHIQFDIELDCEIDDFYEMICDFIILPKSEDGNSVIRFTVHKIKNADDEDDDSNAKTTVPFQIAYALSIHKSQGLEFDSVKIVLTDEIDELITHSIFYTAITRAREKLKLYWTPEVETKIIQKLAPRNDEKDIELLKNHITDFKKH